MSKRRERTRKNVTWTEEMINDLRACREEALALKSSENAPRKGNGRKMGYMDIMKNLWDEKGYSHLGFSSQNLADMSNQNKRKDASQLSQVVTVTLATEINIDETSNAITNNLNNVENVETIQENNKLDEQLLSKLINKSKDIFESVVTDVGNMENRSWKTKFKDVPTQVTIAYIDEICRTMVLRCNLQSNDSNALWTLNCIVYSAIASWIVVNGIVGMEIKRTVSKSNGIPKELKCIDDEIKQTRAFLSKCVAERDRIRGNGRLTRKTKRNRVEIANQCGTISLYALTCLIEQRKKRLKYLSKKRKRKVKQRNSYLLNKEFNENQSRIFNKFKEAIDDDKENLQPVYVEKKSNKVQKYFENQKDVERFWRSLWEAEDKGNPQAEWLTTFREMFREMIPDTDVEVVFSEKDCFDCIKRKKNWSSPGPDRIVNFWWKKLRVTNYVYPIYLIIIQENVSLQKWFCRGRTGLIPKDGEWSMNT